MHKLPKATTNRHPGENFPDVEDDDDGTDGEDGRGFDVGTSGLLWAPKDLGDEVATLLL
jgi:hypothetical protein